MKTSVRQIDTPGPQLDVARTQRELDHLITCLPTILISLTPELQVNRWNPVAQQVFGIEAAAMIGTRLDSSALNWDWTKIAGGLAQCRREGSAVRIDDIGFQNTDSKQGYLGITVTPMLDESGTVLGYIIIGADITDRKALLSQLNQSQKLKSIGQLAAGIAHEINTPTQYVGDNTRFLQEAFEDLRRVLDSYARLLAAVKAGSVESPVVEEVEACLDEADIAYLSEEIPVAIDHTLEGVERISKIVRAMKEFSHPGREEKVPTDINKAIESTITVARNEWKYVAEMQTDLDPTLPAVPCMPGEFNQVVLNMIINAAHAIAEVSGRREGELGRIRIATSKESDHVKVSISDTGAGIAPEIRSRIFDPFFTTKKVGKGTGQGLAICYPVIVDKHSGSIEVNSEVGRGTEFVIRLPLQADPDPKTPQEPSDQKE